MSATEENVSTLNQWDDTLKTFDDEKKTAFTCIQLVTFVSGLLFSVRFWLKAVITGKGFQHSNSSNATISIRALLWNTR